MTVIEAGTSEQGREHTSSVSTIEEDAQRIGSRPALEVVAVVNQLLGYRLIEVEDLARGYEESSLEAVQIAEDNLHAGFESLPED